MKKNILMFALAAGLSASLLCGCNSDHKTSEPSASVAATKSVTVDQNEYKEESEAETKAVSISEKKRSSYLFKKGLPKKKKQIAGQLSPVAVPAEDADGNEISVVMQVHKKLVDNFRGAFQDLKENGYLFKSSQISTFEWKKIEGNSQRSSHSYGCSVDLLTGSYGKSDLDKIRNIMEKHGLCYVDSKTVFEREEYMHFSYLGC